MKVSVIRPEELGAPEIAAWRAMQRATADFDNPFLSPGFAQAAGRVRRAARVAVLEDNQAIVGFLAFERGRLRIGRPIAAGVSDAQAVVHVPGFEWGPRELLRGCGLDAWQFDHLVARQIPCVEPRVRRRESWVMDVSDGYKAYVAGRFKSTLYKERKLDRDAGPTRFEFDAADADALETLLRWKSQQYRRTGRQDRFARPWIRELVHDLFETPREGCAGALSVLYTAHGVVAAHFGLRTDSTLSCWFPVYDPDFSRYSPGLVLHLRMAEAAAQRGLARLELGKGDEEYKQSLKTGSVAVGEGWVRLPSVAAAVLMVRHAAPRLIIDSVLRHPRLRLAARSALRRVGSIRERR